MREPDQTHGTCHHPRHTETEHHGRGDELPATAKVDLEDGHVRGRAHDEEDQKHCRDGDVEGPVWKPPEDRAPGGVRRMLGRWWHLGEVLISAMMISFLAWLGEGVAPRANLHPL